MVKLGRVVSRWNSILFIYLLIVFSQKFAQDLLKSCSLLIANEQSYARSLIPTAKPSLRVDGRANSHAISRARSTKP